MRERRSSRVERLRAAKRRRRALFAVVLAGAAVGFVAGVVFAQGSGSGPAVPKPALGANVSLPKLVGQRLIIGVHGTRASRLLLARIRAGDVGGVILLPPTIPSVGRVRSLTRALQSAAAAGRNPPLLIAIDQEGGRVKRLPGPPTLAPPQMHDPSVARSQGAATGRLLRRAGINVDLAPVLDVPASPSSFIEREGRAFSENAVTVGRLAGAFAAGLQQVGVAATAKHYPGLGAAQANTDFSRVVLTLSPAEFARGVRPYSDLIARGVDLVMLSLARYPAQDASGRPAALSARMVSRLRRSGFGGVTVTDSLDAASSVEPVQGGADALRAGTDIALYATDVHGVYRRMLRAAEGVPRSRLVASYARIVTLKNSLTP